MASAHAYTVCVLAYFNLIVEIRTLSTDSKKSLKMSIIPLWPNLQPRATDPLWFNADRPCDDESEVAALEAEHQAWVSKLRDNAYITNINYYCPSCINLSSLLVFFKREHVRVQRYDHIPIGKTVSDVS